MVPVGIRQYGERNILFLKVSEDLGDSLVYGDILKLYCLVLAAGFVV